MVCTLYVLLEFWTLYFVYYSKWSYILETGYVSALRWTDLWGRGVANNRLVRWKEVTYHYHLTGSRPSFQKTVLNRWITRYVQYLATEAGGQTRPVMYCFKQAQLGMKDASEEGLLYWLLNPLTALRSSCAFGLLVFWATVWLRMRSASCHPAPLYHRSHAVIWRCFRKLLKKIQIQ